MRQTSTKKVKHFLKRFGSEISEKRAKIQNFIFGSLICLIYFNWFYGICESVRCQTSFWFYSFIFDLIFHPMLFQLNTIKVFIILFIRCSVESILHLHSSTSYSNYIIHYNITTNHTTIEYLKLNIIRVRLVEDRVNVNRARCTNKNWHCKRAACQLYWHWAVTRSSFKQIQMFWWKAFTEKWPHSKRMSTEKT